MRIHTELDSLGVSSDMDGLSNSTIIVILDQKVPFVPCAWTSVLLLVLRMDMLCLPELAML